MKSLNTHGKHSVMPSSSASNECRLYLIRHGATINNLARPPRLQGRRHDIELSAEGRQQARQTARLLASLPLDAVYSSPLLRARQTAECIAELHGMDVRVADALIEVDVGDWEGRAWDEIAHTDAEEYEAFMADAGRYPYKGGENLQSVQDRVVPAIERLMDAHGGRSIAVVAHNMVNRCCLAHWLGIGVSQYRAIPQDNCGVNVLRWRNGRTKLVTINAVFHLSDG